MVERAVCGGVRRLPARSFDFKRITDKRWYVPTLLLMPVVSVVVYGLMHALDLPLPASPKPAQSTAQMLGGLPIVQIGRAHV